MNLSFYTAAVGAQQQQRRLDVHGNNIANINTYGYRTEIPAFSALLYGTINGIDGARLPRGTGSYLSAADVDFKGSSVADTGYAQDYAISGSGFFALLDPSTNDFSFTRDGAFTVSGFQVLDDAGETVTKWYLSDGEGRYVLSNDGRPIEVDDPQEPQAVGIFDFINYNGMQHVSGGRFVPVDKNGDVRLGSGKLLNGCLETSNVDFATELARVIETQRSFSYALKMVQTADELETTVNNLR